MAELESGNHAPADSIDKRVASCFELCQRQRVPVLQFRSDSAAYVGEVMNECCRRSITFYIRADNDVAVKRAYSTVDKWRKPKTDKLPSEPYELGVTIHCMATTKEAFSLVAKRQLVEKDASKQCGQCELENLENTEWSFSSISAWTRAIRNCVCPA